MELHVSCTFEKRPIASNKAKMFRTDYFVKKHEKSIDFSWKNHIFSCFFVSFFVFFGNLTTLWYADFKYAQGQLTVLPKSDFHLRISFFNKISSNFAKSVIFCRFRDLGVTVSFAKNDEKCLKISHFLRAIFSSFFDTKSWFWGKSLYCARPREGPRSWFCHFLTKKVRFSLNFCQKHEFLWIKMNKKCSFLKPLFFTYFSKNRSN